MYYFLKNIFFIGQSTTGLDISKNSVRAVSIKRYLKGWKIEGYTEEPYNNYENLPEVISNLKRKLQLKNELTAVNISGPAVRTVSIKIPPINKQEIYSWLIENPSKFLPLNASLSDFVFSYIITGMDNDGISLIVSVSRIEEVKRISNAISMSGLILHTINANGIDIANVISLDSKDLKDISKIVYSEDRNIKTVFLEKGNIKSFNTEINMSPVSALSQDFYNPENQNVKIDVRLYKGENEIKLTDIIIKNNLTEEQIESKYILPLALGLKAVSPVSDINLSTDEYKTSAQQIKDKDLSLRIIASIGFLFIFIIFIFRTFLFYSDISIEKAEIELQNLQDRFIAVSQLEQDRKKLEKQLQEAKKISINRSNFSEILEKIGRSTTKNVWFSKISFTPEKKQQESQSMNIVLSGYALSEIDAAEFLNSLEKLFFLSDIKLTFIQQLSKDDISKQTDGKVRRNLTKFEIVGMIKQ